MQTLEFEWVVGLVTAATIGCICVILYVLCRRRDMQGEMVEMIPVKAPRIRPPSYGIWKNGGTIHLRREPELGGEETVHLRTEPDMGV